MICIAITAVGLRGDHPYRRALTFGLLGRRSGRHQAHTPTRTVIRAPSPTTELNTLLMHSTFLISGPGWKPKETSFGTVFAMAIPYKDDPTVGHVALVTAAHDFEAISGDAATLRIRGSIWPSAGRRANAQREGRAAQ
jgi:hypothetical protein